MSGSEVQRIFGLIGKGNLDQAAQFASDSLNDTPEDPDLLFAAGVAFAELEKYGLAAPLLMRSAELKPENDDTWAILGHCSAQLGLKNPEYYEFAQKCAFKALEINDKNAVACNVVCLTLVWDGKALDALEWGRKAAEYEPNPDIRHAQHNIGLANLMLGNWSKGWWGYECDARRHQRNYGVPVWDGTSDRSLVVYGEQGLGDEVMFASCLPDLMRECTVYLDCEPRLGGLFERSFGCERYTGQKVDAQVPIGSLPKYYRTHDDHFPGTPYLKPDPARRMRFRAVLSALGSRPKIGLAWTGGHRTIDQQRRSLTLDALSPILNLDADFISLQYTPTNDPRVHHWPEIVEARDMDNAAALIAELDLVISVTTTVVHMAGALGKECWALVPRAPQWRYMLNRERMPWYDSVELIRQGDTWPIDAISDRLSQRLTSTPSAPFTNGPTTALPRSSGEPTSPV